MHSHDSALTGPDFWEERYASGAMAWSGNVNDLLVPEVDGLSPGRVLDLGCGTGGDAIWFASRGWTVTGVDIARAALEQAAAHAVEAGVDDRITWEQHDFDVSFPIGEFDLVSACYLQSPVAFERLKALGLAAAAVAPGGDLVVVSHETTPSGAARDAATYLPTAARLFEDLALPDGAWEIVRAETVARSRARNGVEIEYTDNVLHLRRR